MKIIALSDTHLRGGILSPQLEAIIADSDMIVHAGDFDSMECYRKFDDSQKLKAVHGNSDDTELKQLLPERIKFKVEGIYIGVVHNGSLSIMNTNALRYLALEMDVDILIFGHIHRPLIEKSDVTLICPGSPTSPRMASPTVVEINIDGKDVSIRIIEMEGRSCEYIKFSQELSTRSD